MLFRFDTYHKGHHIHPSADKNEGTKNWTWLVLISWDETGTRYYRTLFGPADQGSETQEEALADAVHLGMKWIDDGKPDLDIQPRRTSTRE